MLVPFVACGDLQGFDSDQNYPLTGDGASEYIPLAPVQPPINPPYKRMLKAKRGEDDQDERKEIPL